jgi:hypothetical protein
MLVMIAIFSMELAKDKKICGVSVHRFRVRKDWESVLLAVVFMLAVWLTGWPWWVLSMDESCQCIV